MAHRAWILIALAVALAGIAALRLSSRPSFQAAEPHATDAAAVDRLFAGDRLHDFRINLDPAAWQQLRENFQTNTYYPADIEWGGQRVAKVGVRSRGGATRNGTKPGLQLDFDRYVDGQQFLGLQGLVLDNLWHDPSMIKERVAMQLFQRMGLAAPREVHARVSVGPEFIGVYAIVEAIDERFLKRTYGEDTGYLFDFDRVDSYHLESLGDDPAAYAKYFKPETHEDAPPMELYGPIRDMVRAIDRASPAELEAAVAPYLELDKFLMRVAVENYLAQWDGIMGDLGMANFYLYRFTGTTRMETIAWDQDNTFTSLDFPPWFNLHKNALMRKVWAHAPLRERYLSALLKVAASADGWLEEEVARQYRQIRAAALDDPLAYHSDEEFERAVGFIRRFAKERTAGVREFVSRVRAHPDPVTLRNQ